MTPWTIQANYPLVNFTRINQDTFELSQMQYLDFNEEQTESNILWPIPIAYSGINDQDGLKNTNFDMILMSEQMVYQDPAINGVDTIIINNENAGYYRYKIRKYSQAQHKLCCIRSILE